MIGFAGWIGLVMIGVGHWGWWLAALLAPKFALTVASLLVAYGLGVGWGSVVPSSAVVSMVIALVVAFDIFPPFWPDNIHYKYWAYTVLALWVTGIVVVCLLAKVGQSLNKSAYGWGGRLAMLTGLLLSLWAGAALYQAQWPDWVPWENL